MRVLWISCLLLGSVTSFYIERGYSSGNLAPGVYAQHPVSQKTGSSAPYVGYTSVTDGYEVELPAGYGYYTDLSDASSSVDSSYHSVGGDGISLATNHGDGSTVTTSHGVGRGADEPVFSDVSTPEPVHYSSSRSHYQNGITAFSESTYTPEEVPKPVETSHTPGEVLKPAETSRTPEVYHLPMLRQSKGRPTKLMLQRTPGY